MQLNKNQLSQIRHDLSVNKPTFNTKKEIDNEALRNLRNQGAKNVILSL